MQLDGVAGLGGEIRLSLTKRCTVLVGWNGAGKTLLIEAMRDALLGAWISGVDGPDRFVCDVQQTASQKLTYERILASRPPAPPPSSLASLALGQRDERKLFNERCVQRHADGERELWRISDRQLHYHGKAIPWPNGAGLLMGGAGVLRGTAAKAAETLNDVFWSVIVHAGGPRGEFQRREPIVVACDLSKVSAADRVDSPLGLARVEKFAREIVAWLSPNDLLVLENRGQRVGVLKRLEVRTYKRSEPRPQNDPFPTHAEVLVDGVNLGLISDGTLRALMILRALSAGGRIVMIEQPETELHPGLLKRLLAEIEAAALKRQVILTTHSPVVVSWAGAKDIRLVERRDSRTSVRGLKRGELARLPAYLEHEGTLGEFVFGGALED